MKYAVCFFLIIAWSLDGSNPQVSSQGGPDGLTTEERTKLEKEQKIDNRIKIYAAASARFHRWLQTAVQKRELDRLPDGLNSWLKLLSASLEDIEQNVGRKKKSRALIRYEIQLRKSIKDADDLKHKLPLELQDQISSWIGSADKVRGNFIDILFGR